MKKFIIFGIAMLSVAYVSADVFNYLQFKTSDGQTKTISTNNLQLTIEGNNLVAQSDNEQLEFKITELQTMCFSNTSGVAASVVADGPVTVYGLNGLLQGEYDSLSKASDALSAGVYIIKAADGSTFKIEFGK